MTIATKLKLNTLLVLSFLVVNAAVGMYFVQRMMADARQLAEVKESLEQAILEMEINAGETAQAVFDYIWDHEEKDIEKMHDSERDFERYARQFEQLAETDEERALGLQVAELYRDFKILGDEIVSIAGRRHEDLRLLREDVEHIDELVDEKLDLALEALQHIVQPRNVIEGRQRADLSAGDALKKFRAALDMEIIIHDYGAAISEYVLVQDPGVKRKIVGSETDFGRCITQYRESRMSADEDESLNRIGSDFSEVAIVGIGIVALTDQMQMMMEKFEARRDEIDRILDDEIQVLIFIEAARATKDAQRSDKIAIASMMGAGLFIFVTVAGVGWMVTKGIVDATRQLSEGAAQFSRGNLDHRIDLQSRDELGDVSRAFDQMAESLRQTTVLRDEVIAEAQARELVEEELRRSNSTLVKAVEEERRAKSQRLAAIDELEIAATTDSLTGLSNRTVFMDRLDETMKRSNRDDSRFAVLFFDFDRFKIVNDSLGHEVGDALLRSIARVFRNSVREPDMVARFGGDEFVVLLSRLSEWSEGKEKAERLLHEFAELHDVAGHRIVSTASIGLVTNEHAHQSAADMLRDADAAMYRAKEDGGARIVQFDRAMHERAMSRQSLESCLRFALEDNQLRLVYQPIVSLETGIVSGFEALIRWDHPDRGVVSPIDFISIAEETGLIIDIGRWVLHTACRQIADWNRRLGLEERLSINVNVSKRQLIDSPLVEDVFECLRENDLLLEELKLEITESIISDDRFDVIPLLVELRERGVQIVLDDFGTGVSSLSALHSYPIDVLKIDQSFVRSLDGDRSLLAVVASITALAGNLGISTVAEGIEMEDTIGALQSIDCTWGQGYYFARPMTPVDAEAYLLGIHKQRCGA